MNLLQRIEANRPFTELEAWKLFRLAALGEAVGWTLLICGVALDHYKITGHVVALVLAGQTHGILFLLYFACLLATYSSLRWPRPWFVVAALAGVLPYGTLAFEQWASRRRRSNQRQAERRISVRAIICDGPLILAWQASDKATWELPGGDLLAHETAEAGLRRWLLTISSVTPQIGQLYAVNQPADSRRLAAGWELFFIITNGPAYRHTDFAANISHIAAIEELRFVNRRQTHNLQPAFLKSATTSQLGGAVVTAAKFYY